MYSKTTIVAIVATANAIKIKSEGIIPGVEIPVLDDMIGGIGNFGKNIWDSTTALYDYVASADGLSSDVTYLFSKDFADDVYSVTKDSIVTGEVFADAWDWVTEDGGENWLALGKVALGTGASIAKGDLEQAWNIITNEDLYDEDYYDPETHYRKAYDEYLKKFKKEKIPQARRDIKVVIDRKAARCNSHEPKVGGIVSEFFGLSLNTSENYLWDLG